MDDTELQALYSWVDGIPLSRPKRNIARDFADAVLAAECIAHYHPKLVELHNYPAANSVQQKLYNWDTLNVRVLRKLQATLTRAEIEALVQCRPGAIETFLNGLRLKLLDYKPKQRPKTTLQNQVDSELLIEKEQEIHDLRETIDILEQKIAKLEQLLRLKDAKIAKLKAKGLS